MNRVDRFQQLIEQQASPRAPSAAEEMLVQPLRDLASALEAKARVGARVFKYPDGRSHHLALSPRHRPAQESLVVTVQVANARGVVTNPSMFWFSTADELTGWLEQFVQGPELKATLEDLRELALEPVDARLERSNHMATLVSVSPELQEKLAHLSVGDALPLDLELNEGEPVPEAGALRRLNSAGLIFDVQGATVTARTVHVRVLRSVST